jgi:hypothetical protein
VRRWDHIPSTGRPVSCSLCRATSRGNHKSGNHVKNRQPQSTIRCDDVYPARRTSARSAPVRAPSLRANRVGCAQRPGARNRLGGRGPPSLAALHRLLKEHNNASEVDFPTVGGVLHRAGRYEEAIQRLAENGRYRADTPRDRNCRRAETWSFRAMAEHQLDHAPQAAESLRTADEWTDRAIQNPKAAEWCFRELALRLFRHEARGLIDPTSAHHGTYRSTT